MPRLLLTFFVKGTRPDILPGRRLQKRQRRAEKLRRGEEV